MKRTTKINIAGAFYVLIVTAMGYFTEFYGPINWLWFAPYGISIACLCFYITYQFWMKLIESWP